MKEFNVKRIFGIAAALFIFASCATSATNATTPVQAPEWIIIGQHDRYNSRTYLTAVGTGHSRRAAEMSARTELVSVFGQDIYAKTTESFWETMSSGLGSTWEEQHTFDAVSMTGMDNLIGVEIGDFWEDGRGNNYALAVMNKARASQTYTGMITSN